MSGAEGSPVQTGSGFLAAGEWAPLDGDVVEEAYSLEERTEKGEVTDEGEGEGVRGRRQARRRGGEARMAAMLGVLVAGLITAVLSSLLWWPSQRGRGALLREAWARVAHHEEPWGLPNVQEFEERMSPYVKFGKRELGAAVQKRREQDFPRSGTLGHDVLSSLGIELSDGKRSSLIGAKILLKDMQKLGSGKVERQPLEFYVKRYLGEDKSCVFVEVVELATEKVFAMRLQTLPSKVDGQHVTPELAEMMANQSTVESTVAMLEAVGETPPQRAAEERGLALAYSVATISGVAPIVRGSTRYITANVQLMERFHGNLEEVFAGANIMSMNAKVYAAQRLLTEVMLLQSASVSHNDLKLQNIYTRKDGSFYIGNFDESVRIGERRRKLQPDTASSTEGGLQTAAAEALSVAEAPVAHSQTDLWDLGVCLYKIFLNGDLPYGMKEGAPREDVIADLELRGVRSGQLLEALAQGRVPHKWADLIIGLLEPSVEQRIEAKAILEDHHDLLH